LADKTREKAELGKTKKANKDEMDKLDGEITKAEEAWKKTKTAQKADGDAKLKARLDKMKARSKTLKDTVADLTGKLSQVEKDLTSIDEGEKKRKQGLKEADA